jgi:hypothetical protein
MVSVYRASAVLPECPSEDAPLLYETLVNSTLYVRSAWLLLPTACLRDCPALPIQPCSPHSVSDVQHCSAISWQLAAAGCAARCCILDMLPNALHSHMSGAAATWLQGHH